MNAAGQIYCNFIFILEIEEKKHRVLQTTHFR